MHGTNKTQKVLIQHFKQVEENMASYLRNFP